MCSSVATHSYFVLMERLMRIRKFEVIECPHCGTQYLPAEIFYPKSFFGTPYAIMRSSDGRLIDYEGTSMDISETFECEKCGCNMHISSKVHFVVEEIKEDIFEEEYSSQIKASLFNK